MSGSNQSMKIKYKLKVSNMFYATKVCLYKIKNIKYTTECYI